MAHDRNPRERILFKASPGTFSDNQIDFIDFKELVHYYAEKTHTHGPAYLASARGKLTSYFWSLCLAASLIIALSATIFAFRSFSEGKTSTSIIQSYNTRLSYPVITFCLGNASEKAFVKCYFNQNVRKW